MPPRPSILDVDLMSPDFLFCSGRVVADIQDITHLLDTNKEDVSCDVEPDTLGAWGTGQTS
jgi:hypothetical protein